MLHVYKFLPLLLFSLILGCAYIPTGPGVMVLPGTGKSFDQFREDDYWCRQYASGQVGGVTPNQASTDSGIGSAVVGTAIGAAAGAAFGGGEGAAIGAGSGLLAGSLIGTGTASGSAYETQDRYDMAYTQCMYAKGHRVPVSGQFTPDINPTPYRLPPNIPPPPPGNPPAPPPK